MKQRILTAIIGLAILVPVLLFSGTFFFPIAVSVCCVIALFEMLRCLGLERVWAISLPTYVLAAATPFLVRWADRTESLILGLMLSVCAVLYLMAVSVFHYGKLSFAQLGEALLACLYILFGFNAIVYLRDIADYAVVRPMFDERFPSVPTVFLLAPVCRPGWLIEMECMAVKQMENENFPKL